MKQSLVRALLAVTAVAGFAAPSFATSILLDSCNTVGLCNQVVVTTSFNAGVIDVLVTDKLGAPSAGLFGSSGNNHAFSFNVVDPDSGVTVTVLTAGFTYFGADVNTAGPYGDFDFAIDGPGQGGAATLPLHFTVSRSGTPFTSDSQLFELNDAGYYFTAHVAINAGTDGAVTGWAASNHVLEINPTVDPPPVPEPGSMILLGTGLLGLAAGVRRRAKK